MTFYLYILRHAKSDWADVDLSDFERPLNKRGNKAAVRIGRWIAENKKLPEKIISSPAIRAKQTIELVVKQFADTAIEKIIYEKELYLAELELLLEYIQRYKTNVNSLMIVAHNPGLEQLIHFLSNESENYESMTTANLVIFEYVNNAFDPLTDKGKLIEFIKPRALN